MLNSEDILEIGENKLEQTYQDDSNNGCYNGTISFVAFEIESRLLKAKGCVFCKKALRENERVGNQHCIGENIPCESTFAICKLADAAITRFNDNAKDKLNEKVINSVVRHINFIELYPYFFERDHDEDHKHFLIRFIINEYIHLKCTFLSKQKNLDMHKNYFRNMYWKTIQRAGQ